MEIICVIPKDPPTFPIDGLGKHGGVTRGSQEQMTSSRFIRAILGISHRELGWGKKVNK